MALTRRSFVSASLIVPTAGLPAILPMTAAADDSAPWTLIAPEAERTFSINGEAAGGTGNPGQPIAIPPGAREAHIRLTYDQPEVVNTSFVDVQVADMGAGINPAKIEAPSDYVVWRPGDDRDYWLTLKIHQDVADGDRFLVYLKAGGFAKSGACIVEVAASAVNDLPATMPRHRKPMVLTLPAQATVELDIAATRWSDSGYIGNATSGTPCWRSRLTHGYTQAANGENGLYTNAEVFPDVAVEPQSIAHDADGRPFIRLHSARFQEPVSFEGKSYPFQASVLQAQRLDEWCRRRGIYEADLAIPSQKGAWSGFWLIGRDKDGKVLWPPEIDCCESFNGVYGAAFTPATISAGEHVGRHGSGKRQNVVRIEMDLRKLGFKDLDLNRTSHRHACVIGDEWVTHYVDGRETVMYRNMTGSQTGNTQWGFFPIFTVAVKASDAEPYADGDQADLRLYALRYYDGAA